MAGHCDSVYHLAGKEQAMSTFDIVLKVVVQRERGLSDVEVLSQPDTVTAGYWDFRWAISATP